MTKVLLMMFVCCVAAHAQWQPHGVAVCDTPGSGAISKLPEVTSDGSGGAYVVWRDGRNGVDYDVYAQRVDNSGVIRWLHNGIPIAALPGGGQDYPMVCYDGVGGMLTAWEDSRPTLNDTYVFAQRVDSSGNQLWQTNGVKISDASGGFVRMAADLTGGVVVGWTSYSGIGESNPFVQRLDGLGQRAWGDSGVCLSTRSGELSLGEMAVTGDGSGGAIAAWIEGSSTYAQRVDSSGKIRWQANGVSLSGNAQYDRFATGAVSDMQGGAFVTWTLIPNAGVYLQHISGSGQVLWADTGLYVSYGGTAGNIVSDSAGGAIILTGYAVGSHIVDRLYRVRANGTHHWVGGAPYTQEAISEVSLASDGNGGAFVAMTKSGGRVNAQWIDSSGTVRYDSNGVVMSNVGGGKEQPRIATAGVGEAIGVWNLDGAGYTSVYAAKVADTVVVDDVRKDKRTGPSELRLLQNYPNPFNPETTIEFVIPNRGRVTLKIFDVLGRVVDTLIDEQRGAGTYHTRWRAINRSSGVYFLALQLNGSTLVKKMILLR
jgi:hypothetical protein